jgi:ABC-type Na+ efflux pump permease subunit
MRNFFTIAAHSLRANLRHRQGMIAIAVLLLGIVPVFFAMKGMLAELLAKGPWDIVAPWVVNTLGLSGYLVALLCVVFLGVMLGVGTLTQEKAKGALEALLATPLGPWALWWGKVAGCFLPAFAAGMVVSFGVLWALNAAAVVPVLGNPLFPGPVVATVGVGVPFLGLGIAALVNLIGLLVANPNIASLSVVVIVLAVSNVLPRLGLEFAEWSFAWVNAGTGLFILATSLLFAWRLLTKERIVLSAKRL